MNSCSREELEIKLFYLAATGDLEGTKRMVESGVSVNAADYNSRTPLHVSALRGQIELVEYLIAKSADVNCKDNGGQSPLDVAILGKHVEIQRLLRKCGATSPRSDMLTSRRREMNATFAVMEVFPKPIAKAMLEGRKVDSISKDNVSLFFSDVVGYTNMTSTMQASKVANILRRLFHKFDRLAHLHGVQKIDTIGDAYFAATNFTEDQPDDHALRMADFAIAALDAAKATLIDEDEHDNDIASTTTSGCVQIRIGLHCGLVSGIVVGSNCVKFTLLGDAVNTASRMQSTGSPGRIQCTDAMASAISHQQSPANRHRLIRREGGVEVKGKGHMTTFWVSSARRRCGLRCSGASWIEVSASTSIAGVSGVVFAAEEVAASAGAPPAEIYSITVASAGTAEPKRPEGNACFSQTTYRHHRMEDNLAACKDSLRIKYGRGCRCRRLPACDGHSEAWTHSTPSGSGFPTSAKGHCRRTDREASTSNLQLMIYSS